jgi:hypothetical protein
LKLGRWPGFNFLRMSIRGKLTPKAFILDVENADLLKTDY